MGPYLNANELGADTVKAMEEIEHILLQLKSMFEEIDAVLTGPEAGVPGIRFERGADWGKSSEAKLPLIRLAQWAIYQQLKPKPRKQKPLGFAYCNVILAPSLLDESVADILIPYIAIGFGIGDERYERAYDVSSDLLKDLKYLSANGRLFHSREQPAFGWKELFRIEEDIGGDDYLEWVFAIPLYSVNSPDDVRRYITRPMTRLLTAGNAHDAFEGVPALEFSMDTAEGSLRCTNLR